MRRNAELPKIEEIDLTRAGQDFFGRLGEEPTDPLTAYQTFFDEVGTVDTYVSTAITSGGHSEIPGKNMGEIIRDNSRVASFMVDKLVQHVDLDPSKLVLPSDMPNIKGWRQADYMMFWFSVMAGVNGDDAGEVFQNFERLHGPIDPRTSDTSAPVHTRRALYARLAEAYHRSLTSYIPHEPITNMVQLVDPERSLGCFSEGYFAWRKNIPTHRIEATPEAFGDLQGELGRLSLAGVNLFTHDTNSPVRLTQVLGTTKTIAIRGEEDKATLGEIYDGLSTMFSTPGQISIQEQRSLS